MIYFVLRESDNKIKIGHSGNFLTRELSLAKEHGSLRFLGWVSGGRTEESNLHDHFSHCHYQGEWFTPHETLIDWIMDNTHPSHPKEWELSFAESERDNRKLALELAATTEELKLAKERLAENHKAIRHAIELSGGVSALAKMGCTNEQISEFVRELTVHLVASSAEVGMYYYDEEKRKRENP